MSNTSQVALDLQDKKFKLLGVSQIYTASLKKSQTHDHLLSSSYDAIDQIMQIIMPNMSLQYIKIEKDTQQDASSQNEDTKLEDVEPKIFLQIKQLKTTLQNKDQELSNEVVALISKKNKVIEYLEQLKLLGLGAEALNGLQKEVDASSQKIFQLQDQKKRRLQFFLNFQNQLSQQIQSAIIRIDQEKSEPIVQKQLQESSQVCSQECSQECSQVCSQECSQVCSLESSQESSQEIENNLDQNQKLDSLQFNINTVTKNQTDLQPSFLEFSSDLELKIRLSNTLRPVSHYQSYIVPAEDQLSYGTFLNKISYTTGMWYYYNFTFSDGVATAYNFHGIPMQVTMIDQAATPVTKIRCYFWEENELCGIELFGNDGQKLLATQINTNIKCTKVETVLTEGERIIGFRSKQYNQDYPAAHSHFQFVIGRMA